MKNIEPICKNCFLFDREKKECKAAILIGGVKYNMPVSPEDHCHMDELGIEVNQIRWFEEDHKVKIEYPENFLR